MISWGMNAEEMILDDHINLKNRAVIYTVKSCIKSLQKRLDDIGRILIKR